MRGPALFFLCFLVPFAAAAQGNPRVPVVINEILFNPKPGAFDYIELYNRSDSSIDLSTLFLTNRTASGNYGPLKKISDTTHLLQPGAYVVCTEDTFRLTQHFFVKQPEAVLVLASLPSYPNAEGTVVLADSAGTIWDAVHYNEDWHFALLADKEGVALERVDPEGASDEKQNWSSAASDAGYGTPGYKNSIYKLFQNGMVSITLTPKVFSPDGDGFDDAATIAYAVPQSGYVANVVVYDASGKQVRHLVKNAVLGIAGTFTWNGLDEQGRTLPTGQYILFTQLFTLQGRQQPFKNVVVLARRIN